MVINKEQIHSRFKKSISSYDENAQAQKVIVSHLMRLTDVFVPFRPVKMLEIGCGTGILTEKLVEKYGKTGLAVNDLVGEMCRHTAERCGLEADALYPGDIEKMRIGGPFSLIVSASTFQWLASPSATLRRLAASLTAGGILVFSTFGKKNFKELRNITGNGLAYRSLTEMQEMLSESFEVIHDEENREVLEFTTPYEVLQHLKKTGVNALPAADIWTRTKLAAFEQAYETYRLSDGKYPLTYHPQYFVCRKWTDGDGQR